jgi:hypothetical protein
LEVHISKEQPAWSTPAGMGSPISLDQLKVGNMWQTANPSRNSKSDECKPPPWRFVKQRGQGVPDTVHCHDRLDLSRERGVVPRCDADPRAPAEWTILMGQEFLPTVWWSYIETRASFQEIYVQTSAAMLAAVRSCPKISPTAILFDASTPLQLLLQAVKIRSGTGKGEVFVDLHWWVVQGSYFFEGTLQGFSEILAHKWDPREI